MQEQGPRTVAIDVDEGNRLDIQATPTFIVEGKTYAANLQAWVQARIEGADSDGGAKAP